LVTGVPASPGTDSFVDPDTLTDAQIVTFVQTYLQPNITTDGWNLIDGSLFGITTGTTVYSGGYTNNIMQYAVEEVPSLTFTYAFNTLTPSTAADISQITNVAEWAFQTYVIAVDTAARYGLRAESGGGEWILLERSATIYGGTANRSASYGIVEVGNYSRLLEFDNRVGDMTSAKVFTGNKYFFRQVYHFTNAHKTDRALNNKPNEETNSYCQWTQTEHPNDRVTRSLTPAIGLDNRAFGGVINTVGTPLSSGRNDSLVGLVLPETHTTGCRYVTMGHYNIWGGTQVSNFNNDSVRGPYHLTINDSLYDYIMMMELYIWTGPKPSIYPTGSLATPSP
jgi:hypothetical protein